MEWTTEKPAQAGWYWVMAYELCYGSPYPGHKPELHCVKVEASRYGISFDIPYDGCEAESTIRPEHVTHWMGPIPQPEPPTKDAE